VVGAVGLSVGEGVAIVGDAEGLVVGDAEGPRVGEADGVKVGESVGLDVGLDVGGRVVGVAVGLTKKASSLRPFFSPSLAWTETEARAMVTERSRRKDFIMVLFRYEYNYS